MRVDIDPELVQQSNTEAQRRGLPQRLSFRQQDGLHPLAANDIGILRVITWCPGFPPASPRHANSAREPPLT
jgi:hypothetical protein